MKQYSGLLSPASALLLLSWGPGWMIIIIIDEDDYYNDDNDDDDDAKGDLER